MTKGELAITLRGLREADRQHRKLWLWVAWHIAALTRSRKRLPSLRSLLQGEEKPPSAEEFQSAREAHGDIERRLGGK